MVRGFSARVVVRQISTHPVFNMWRHPSGPVRLWRRRGYYGRKL